MLSGPLYSQGLAVENPKTLVYQGIWGSRGEQVCMTLICSVFRSLFLLPVNRSYQDLQVKDQGEVPLVLVRSYRSQRGYKSRHLCH